MKFVAHRNSKTLVGHYLDDMSNVDGTAAFLGLEQRRNLAEDFRSASMERNPDLRHSLPAKTPDELEHRQDFVALSEQTKRLSNQIRAAITEEAHEELRARWRQFRNEWRKLVEELEKYREGQRRVYTTYCEAHD